GRASPSGRRSPARSAAPGSRAGSPSPAKRRGQGAPRRARGRAGERPARPATARGVVRSPDLQVEIDVQAGPVGEELDPADVEVEESEADAARTVRAARHLAQLLSQVEADAGEH